MFCFVFFGRYETFVSSDLKGVQSVLNAQLEENQLRVKDFPCVQFTSVYFLDSLMLVLGH